MGVRGVCTDTNLSLSKEKPRMTIYVSLVFLLASFGMAIVRKSASTEALALWAIASALILPHVLHLAP